MLLDGLEAGQGVCEDAYPFVGCECGECRVNGYKLGPHDSAGLFYSCGIYVDGSTGGDVHHRRPYLDGGDPQCRSRQCKPIVPVGISVATDMVPGPSPEM